jgi:hypothetical protein
MLELQLLALEMAASVELSTVSATPAPWPKPSVTLVPPDILIEIAPRETRRSQSFAA